MTPRRLVLRAFWALHRAVRRVTGGRLGTSEPHDGRLGTLFLHTTGRRTGKPRVTGLYYLRDGDNVVVVASNAGEPSDPAWWTNLVARPSAEVEIDARRHPVVARRATGPEGDRLWPRLVAAFPDYGRYRVTAGRPIPLVILEPRFDTGDGPTGAPPPVA